MCIVLVVKKQGTVLAIYMTSYLPVQCFLTICTAGGQEIITVLAIYMTCKVVPASAVFLDHL